MTRTLLAALATAAALVALLVLLPVALALALPALLWDADEPREAPEALWFHYRFLT